MSSLSLLNANTQNWSHSTSDEFCLEFECTVSMTVEVDWYVGGTVTISSKKPTCREAAADVRDGIKSLFE